MLHPAREIGEVGWYVHVLLDAEDLFRLSVLQYRVIHSQLACAGSWYIHILVEYSYLSRTGLFTQQPVVCQRCPDLRSYSGLTSLMWNIQFRPAEHLQNCLRAGNLQTCLQTAILSKWSPLRTMLQIILNILHEKITHQRSELPIIFWNSLNLEIPFTGSPCESSFHRTWYNPRNYLWLLSKNNMYE